MKMREFLHKSISLYQKYQLTFLSNNFVCCDLTVSSTYNFNLRRDVQMISSSKLHFFCWDDCILNFSSFTSFLGGYIYMYLNLILLQIFNVFTSSVTFEHGFLKKEEARNINCGIYRSDDLSNKCKVAAVADGGDVVYQGDVNQDEDDLCRTFLAVRNKKTNKVYITEI